jgi:hypothetical protein
MGARASPIGLVVAVLLLGRLPAVLATRGLPGNIGGGEGAFFLVWTHRLHRHPAHTTLRQTQRGRVGVAAQERSLPRAQTVEVEGGTG